jgi:hypothetical protein
MATQRNAAFTGVPFSSARVNDVPLQATDIDELTADVGLTHEVLTGTNADGGGGAPVVAQHLHTEAGNLIRLPWGGQTFPGGLHVDGTSMSADTFVMAIPFYVPAGFTQGSIVLHVEPSGGFPGAFWARLFNASSFPHASAGPYASAVSGFEHVDLVPAANEFSVAVLAIESTKRDSLYACTFTVTANTVYVAYVYARVVEMVQTIRGYHVGPAIDAIKRGLRAGNERRVDSDAFSVTVGNPDSSNAFQGLDSALVQPDVPLGPQAILTAHNLNRIHELAFGLPAPGKTSLTLTKGHDHSGTGEYGSGISRGLMGWTFGRPSSNANIYGRWSLGPFPLSTSFGIVGGGQIRTPVSANNSSGASKIRAAVLCNSDVGKGQEFVCRVTIGGTSVDYSAPTVGANLFHLLTSSSGFAFTSGGYTTWGVQVKDTGAGSDHTAALMGIVIYMVP